MTMRVHGLEPGSAVLRDRDIIYFSCVEWDWIRQRPQQITIQLARSNRVLYVEPMLSLATRARRGFENPLPGMRWMAERLLVYRPPSFLPFSLRNDLANRINKVLLRSSVQRVAKAVGFSRPIVGVSHPQHHELIGHFGEVVSFYDCMDQYGALPDPRANLQLLAAMERRLIEKVDLVFVSSLALLEEKGRHLEACILVRNGVEFAHFSDGVPNDGSVPPELKRIPPPILGYIGALGEWIDGEALSLLAESRPDWSLVMVGPVLDRAVAKRLSGYRNVHLLGVKPYEDLPRMLDAFAVALIPFKVNRVTCSIDPVKLYEYLAAGRPVVASNLPEVRRFGDLVSIYTAPSELVGLVEANLKELGEDAVLRRRRVAMENTWEQRTADMASAILKRLETSSELLTSA